jgi:lysophospholipase L1-like esterase
MKRLVGLGDSLTKGAPGAGYLDYIKSIPTYNFGRGGDTLISLRVRVEAKRFDATDQFVLMIGMNDFLLPLLKERSWWWRQVVAFNARQGKIPSRELGTFRQNYEALLACLPRERVITLITIPPLGEDPDSDVNRSIRAANDLIQTLASERDVAVIDFFAAQMAELTHPNAYVVPSPFRLIMDLVLTRCAFFRTVLVKRRGLTLSTDGVHLNDASAKRLAALVESVLSKRD